MTSIGQSAAASRNCGSRLWCELGYPGGESPLRLQPAFTQVPVGFCCSHRKGFDAHWAPGTFLHHLILPRQRGGAGQARRPTQAGPSGSCWDRVGREDTEARTWSQEVTQPGPTQPGVAPYLWSVNDTRHLGHCTLLKIRFLPIFHCPQSLTAVLHGAP